jgi:hypothetical protein
MLHSQRRLHETGDTGGTFGMAYDSFYTTNIQWIFIGIPFPMTKEDIRDSLRFLGIPRRSSGPYSVYKMTFKVR